MKNMENSDVLACPFCKKSKKRDPWDDEGDETPSGMKNGKCLNCGAWMDSYGIIHKAKCSGGFHEDGECPVK